MDVNENLEKRARGGWGIIHMSDARDFVLLHFGKYNCFFPQIDVQ